MIPVYMTSLPPGTIPKIWLRDDLDLTRFKQRPRERIVTYTSKGGTWKHRALVLPEEELNWRCPIHPQWRVVIPEFWRRFHALVRTRYQAATSTADTFAYVQWLLPPTLIGSISVDQEKDPTGVVHGTFALWVGDESVLHPIETGEVDIKTLPEFAGAHIAQTDLKIPFTWTPAERLDRYDVVYQGEIEP